jgi:hypothetical protein
MPTSCSAAASPQRAARGPCTPGSRTASSLGRSGGGREALLSLHVRDRRSGYPLETVLRAATLGWRIAEVDVPYRPRKGRSKVTGTVRGTLTAVHDMRRVLAEGHR